MKAKSLFLCLAMIVLGFLVEIHGQSPVVIDSRIASSSQEVRIAASEGSNGGSWLTNITIGLISSVFASLIFTAALSVLKPKVKIAPVICKHSRVEKQWEHEMTDEQKRNVPKSSWKKEQDKRYIEKEVTRFFVKIINQTSFDLFDVETKLKLAVPYLTAKGEKTLRVSYFPLSAVGHVSTIPRLSKKDPYHTYAMLISTTSPLEEHWSHFKLQEQHQAAFIQVEFVARHGFSGFAKVIRQKFENLDQIQAGQFESGNTFAVNLNKSAKQN